jgi:uncharacterized protein YukE
MILQNEKLGKEFDRLMNQMFFTFARWELYENLEKIIDGNELLKEAILKNKIDFCIFKFLSVSLGKDILVSLSSMLKDSDSRSLSLLQILYKVLYEKEDCQIQNFIEILKGNFSLLSRRLKRDVKYFECELEKRKKIGEIQNLFEMIKAHLKDLTNLVEKINLFSGKSLLKNIEEVEKIKKDLLELRNNLQETLKNIKNEIEIIKEEKISATQYQEEIEKLDKEIEILNNIKEELEIEVGEIIKNVEQLYQSIVFKIVWDIRNKFIAHFSREEFPRITISLKEVHEVTEKIIKEILKILRINITQVTPIYQGNYFTAFMIPWLQPACNESQKLETISKIDKYKDEDHFVCDLTLTNGLSFYIGDFPSEYKWEKGDEVAIFWSYNYQNPQSCFVICNFSKKQWVKGMVSWVSNRNGSWILPKI